ncbi:MAG: DUF1648 domain-containing protein [Fibrobacteres bacterium]|nr:DUF1648 domain-containing protein [Fibrobacterota bacterium]
MKTKSFLQELPACILVLSQIITAIFLYGSLPDVVPIHWNIRGEIDNYGDKAAIFLLPFVSLFIFIVMSLASNFDPKFKSQSESARNKFVLIKFAIVLLLTTIFANTIFSMMSQKMPNIRLILGAASIFIAFVGNYMGKFRPNSTVGFRIPGTWLDEEGWNKTNRMSGRLLVISGILSFFAVLFLPIIAGTISFIGLTIAATLAAFFYAFRLKRKQDL